MDLKVVDNFLPPKVFNRLLKIVESHSFSWVWNNDTYINPVTKKGDNLWMFSQILFNSSNMTGGSVEHPMYAAFQVIEDYQAEIYSFKQVVKAKLNLYPNQGKNVSHGKHIDVYFADKIDKHIVTSILNFHTCNGSTVIEIEGKNRIFPSKANQLILFDNTWHYGVTQSDIPRRIVLNLNVLKHISSKK